jgi:hypothetical protein
MQNSIQSKCKYHIRNQHIKLHINYVLSRIFHKKTFSIPGVDHGEEGGAREKHD